VEDEIEMERQKVLKELKDTGKVGTPVTPETFAIWNEAKKLKRQAEIKKRVEQELKKKKGGKGLSILSGRDLYEYKKELFNKFDDENDDTVSMMIMSGASSDDDDDGVTNAMTTTTTTYRQTSMDVNDDEIVENGDDINHKSQGGQNGKNVVNDVTTSIQSDLFLQGDDDDLDELDED
jgi:DRG Family Regulatory Proteins, Tma46